MSVGLACMPSRRAWGAVASVLVGAVVVLGGCTPGGGSTPVGTSGGTTSATSSGALTTSPSGTSSTATGSWTALPYPSDVPEAARPHTDAGAEAFVRHWVDVQSSAWTRPEAGLLPLLCLPTSKSCANTEATAAELVANRRHYSGTPVSITSAVIFGPREGALSVLVLSVQEERSIIDDKGNVVEKVPRSSGTLDFRLVWQGERWWVSGIYVDLHT